MAKQLTWADIASMVAEIHQREGAKPNRTLYLSLGNEFLAIVAEQTRCYRTSWTNNGSPAENVITGNSWPLPIEVIEVTRVEWDGDDCPLERASQDWLDQNCAGWRSASGGPGYYTIEGANLLLDTNPTGSVTGKLVVRGCAYLPELSDDTSAANPVEYLPVGLQRSAADYILANLPHDPSIPAEAARQAQYAAKIQVALGRMAGGLGARQTERFRF